MIQLFYIWNAFESRFPFEYIFHIILHQQINLISTGFILRTCDLKSLKIFLDGNMLMEYDNTSFIK